MAGKADPMALLAADKRAALKLADDIGTKKTVKLLTRAQNDLDKRLRTARSLEGPGSRSFTATQLEVTLRQVRQVMKEIQRGLHRNVLELGEKAAVQAAGQTVDFLERSERRYKGVSARLDLDTVAVMDRAKSGTRSSILNRLQTDPDHPAQRGVLDRYGDAVIQNFEKSLQLRLVAKQPWADVRANLIADSPFLQGKPMHWAERIVRTECLVGETPVTGGMVKAAFRRRYEGDVIQIITEAGRDFTTTPNHPMLTSRTWLGSAELREGDYLVCYDGKQNAGSPGNEDVATPPATIAEIFDSFSTVGIGERRRTTQPDFHGDGRNGEVDVFSSNGVLRVGKFASIYQPLAQDIFAPADFSRATFCSSCCRLLSIDKQPCICRSSDMNPGILETIHNWTIRGVVDVRQMLNAFALQIAFNDLRGGQVLALAGMAESSESIQCCLRSASHEPLVSQRSLQSIRSDVGLGSGPFGAQARDIEFDRVREVRVLKFAGHVYNLSTTDGYFAINGAYTGNTMAAHNRSAWEATREANKLLGGNMVKILSATFDGRTGADSFAVHGQIRRPDEAFEWWDGFYMHPPNRPNDREVVVPHRIEWPIPAGLMWKTSGDIASRWAMKGRKGSPPRRPNMTTVKLERFGVG